MSEKPVYVMVSGDVKAANLQRLKAFDKLDIYRCYQHTHNNIDTVYS